MNRNLKIVQLKLFENHAINILYKLSVLQNKTE